MLTQTKISIAPDSSRPHAFKSACPFFGGYIFSLQRAQRNVVDIYMLIHRADKAKIGASAIFVVVICTQPAKDINLFFIAFIAFPAVPFTSGNCQCDLVIYSPSIFLVSHLKRGSIKNHFLNQLSCLSKPKPNCLGKHDISFKWFEWSVCQSMCEHGCACTYGCACTCMCMLCACKHIKFRTTI